VRIAGAILLTGIASTRAGAYRGGMAVARRLVLALLLTMGLVGSSALPAGGAPPSRVVLVTYNCGGRNFLCRAFERAMRGTGVSGRIISPDGREDPLGTLSLLAAQGYDPVIVDLNHASGLAEAAARFPRTRFIIFDATLAGLHVRRPNVQAIVDEPQGAAYLAGWLSARMVMRRHAPHVVGVVGGIPVPGVENLITGFIAGVRRADPRMTVLKGYSRNFVDPNKCEAIARTQIAHGAGVVFNVAGACGLGTLAAAKQAGVWAIGVDTDQSNFGSFVLTSVIKRYDVVFSTVLRQVASDTLRTHGGTTVVGLRAGAAVLGPISAKVPAPLRAGLARLRARLLSGSLVVVGAPRG
jgi:basic membrane protein A